MALRDQPYIPLYIQDFLTDEKLIECSAQATGVYIRLMCIMHKSDEYGKFLLKQKDKQKSKQIENFAIKLAKQMPYSEQVIFESLNELLDEKVLSIEGDFLIQKRMVNDNLLSLKRSQAGSKGGKFAQAKIKANTNANTEYENVIENESRNIIESFEEKFKHAFDDITIETYKMTFRERNIKTELQEFLTKCNSAKDDYHQRDISGLRLAFQYQLKNSRNGTGNKKGVDVNAALDHINRHIQGG